MVKKLNFEQDFQIKKFPSYFILKTLVKRKKINIYFKDVFGSLRPLAGSSSSKRTREAILWDERIKVLGQLFQREET